MCHTGPPVESVAASGRSACKFHVTSWPLRLEDTSCSCPAAAAVHARAVSDAPSQPGALATQRQS